MKIIHLTPDDSGNVDWPLLSADKKSVVTVGVFDGVHRGHRAVIQRTIALAKKYHALSVVIMFEPRPAFVHAYAKTHANAELPVSEDGVTTVDGGELPADARDTNQLTSVNQRLRSLNSLGVDYVLIVNYTLAFSDKSFRFFLGQLVGRLGMRTLVLGSDASLGAGRAGTIDAINLLSQATGMFELDVVNDEGHGKTRVPQDHVPTMPTERGPIDDVRKGMSKAEFRAWSKKVNSKEVRDWSSTNVRFLLGQGAIEDANMILGTEHGVEGKVVHGEERGRTLGFPTANVEEPVEGYMPVEGVYAGWLIDLGKAEDFDNHVKQLRERSTDGIPHQYESGGVEARLALTSPLRWPAIISIGSKPTFKDQTGSDEKVLEAYAITRDPDQWLDLYGHRVRVEFAQFLRPQIKFDSADDLKAELERNVAEAKEVLDVE